MNKDKLIKVQLKKVYCWVDLDTQEVYSPRFRLLKPQLNIHDGCYYYRIFCDGEVETKNKNTIMRLANEILFGENRKIR